jgi:long-chain-fatty-acid--[acyl-carrier-protein] ligase
MIIRWLLKLRYRIRTQGFEEIPQEPVVIILDRNSALDPVIFRVVWKRSFTALLTAHVLRKLPRFLQRGFSIFKLPDFDNRIPAFSSRRLMKRLEEFSCEGDLVVMTDSRRSPLLTEVLKKHPGKVYFAKVSGIRGSHFSFDPSNEARKIKPRWSTYFWMVLKNVIFFMPKRSLFVTFAPASQPIPQVTEEANLFITHWFMAHKNTPRISVSYYFWKKREKVDNRIGEIVMQELARLSKKEAINEEMDLYEDLNLDSLDVTEILVFLEKTFHQKTQFNALRTVRHVIQAAQGIQPGIPSQDFIFEKRKKGWAKERPEITFAEGKSIPEVFLRSCDRMGNAFAAVDPRDALSYTRMKTTVVGLVELLEKLPGKNIGILLPSLCETMSIVLALMMARKVPAMLNWTLGNRHIEEVTRQAEIQTIITIGPMLNTIGYELSDILIDKIVLFDEIKGEITTAHREKGIARTRLKTDELLKELGNPDPHETAVLLFTSGTEKAPKGVPLTHSNVLSNIKSAIEHLGFTSKDVLFGILPPFHVFGFSFTHLLPLIIGCRVVFNPLLLELATVIRLINDYQVTMICTAPTFLKALVAMAKPGELDGVRSFIVGAEKAPPSLRDQLPKTSQLLEGYGMTECSPLVALNHLGDPTLGVGFPVKDVKIQLVDSETHQPISNGIGLIAVKGPNVFKGYLNGTLPFITLEGEGWFLTGDLGNIEKGALHLVGRLSRTIKIGGELISFPALEQTLQIVYPGVQVAIVAHETQLILYVNRKLDLDEVNQSLKQQGWSNLVRIKEVRFLDQLPLTSTGKIDYKKL